MRQIKKLFTEHEMILVIHMFNIPKHAYVEQTLHLRRKGLQVITYPNELIQYVWNISKICVCSNFFEQIIAHRKCNGQ